jgi:hypothetical protein
MAADGLAGVVAAATEPAVAKIGLFDLIPREPFGYKLVVWIGGIIWLAIAILIFGSYL